MFIPVVSVTIASTFLSISLLFIWDERIERGRDSMRPEDQQVLLCVARRVMENKRKHVQTIRRLAGSEENYLLLIREINRVEAQLFKARSLRAAATLTIVDWLAILNTCDWQCAYCEVKPFQVMSHILPLPNGGTTIENCVPACYSCGRSGKSKKEQLRLQDRLVLLINKQTGRKEQCFPMKQLSLSLSPYKYAVCQFHPDKHIPYWALIGEFVSLTRTHEELSVICQEDNVPQDIEAERGWCCVEVHGAFDFTTPGINASLAVPLAQAEISVLAIATFATDYLLVKEEYVERALQVLTQAGHRLDR